MSKTKLKMMVVGLALIIVATAILLVLGNNGVGPFAKKSVPDVAVAADHSNMAMPPAEHTHESNNATMEKSAQPPLTKQQKALYRCPMHPSFTSDKPGQCPICGMDLVKVEPEKQDNAPSGQMGVMPQGFGMVELSREKIQLIGVRTVPAGRSGILRTVRAPATVAVDERRIKQVQSKVQGWIDKLYVNFTGQYVNKGQALLTIYSPDLVSTQEEYLLAARNLKSLEGASPEIREGAENLLKAARRRLQYWDISAAQIRRLEQTGEPTKTLTLYSPARGYVTDTKPVQGMEVKPGMPLYTISDLSQVWVMASVYEQDLSLIKKGMEVTFHTDSYPNKDFTGKVAYINPELNPQSRTATVRIELANPDMVLRPEMYGFATLVKQAPDVLAVPASAIMNNGEIKLVYVETEPGHYMPRQVKVGIITKDRAEILDGLKEGEPVVVEGNFMLDSESRLRASAQGTTGGMEGMPGMQH